MISPEQQCWQELTAREDAGELLSAEDRARKNALSAKHPEFRRESEIYESLSRALSKAQGPASGDDRLIQTALRWMSAVTAPPGRLWQRRWLSLAVACVVGAGATFATFELSRRGAGSAAELSNHASAPRTAALAQAQTARLAWTSGTVRVDGKDVRAGVRLPIGTLLESSAESACLGFERGILACIAPETSVRITALGKRQQLELTSGRVTSILDPQPEGAEFSVTTPNGAVVAVGTIFAVEVEATSAVVRVEEGAVAARTRELDLLVRHGQELRLGADNLEPIGTAAFERDVGLLSTPALASPDRVRRVVSAREALLSKQVTATNTKSDDASAPDSRRQKTESSASALLRQAREARARAAYGDAARYYERLIRSHPDSAEGKAALIAWAELCLSRFGQPARALELYDRYLSSGGKLAPEARYGKIQALRAQGRVAEERREITAFLDRYPTSAYASSLRKRLQSP